MAITRSQSKKLVENTSRMPKIENVYSLAHDNDSRERCEVETPKIDYYFSLANVNETYNLNRLIDFEPILKLTRIETVVQKKRKEEMTITRSQSKKIVKNTSWFPKIENVYSLAEDNDSYERCEVATPKIDYYFSLANGNETYDLNRLTGFEPILKLTKI